MNKKPANYSKPGSRKQGYRYKKSCDSFLEGDNFFFPCSVSEDTFSINSEFCVLNFKKIMEMSTNIRKTVRCIGSKEEKKSSSTVFFAPG